MLTRIITINSILMATVTSSLVMLLLFIIRKTDKYFDRVNPKVFSIIYVLCFIRMVIPVEIDGFTRPLSGGKLWRIAYQFLSYCLIDNESIKVTTLDMLCYIWLIVAFFRVIKYIHDYRKLHRVLWGFSDEVFLDTDVFLKNTRFVKTKVIRTSCVESPCCMGVFRRVIVVPCVSYSKKEFIQIMQHENEHLNNYDVLIKIIINLLCKIYWWNPLAYLLQRNLNQSLEICCDLRVIKDYSKESKIEYLETILTEYKRNNMKYSGQNLILAMADGDADELFERFKIISSDRRRNCIRNHVFLSIFIMIIFGVSYFFVIQANFEPTEKEIGRYERIVSLDAYNSYISKTDDGKYFIYYKHSFIEDGIALHEISEDELGYYIDSGIRLKE